MGKKIRVVTVFLALVFSFVLTDEATAQPAAGGPSGPPVSGDPPCWPPPCIPIDGGVGFLIAAGVLYGAKKTYDFSKAK